MHVQEGSVADAPLIFMGLRCGAHIDDMYQVCRSSASAPASRSAPDPKARTAPGQAVRCGPEDLVRSEITNCAYTHLLHAESSNMNGLVTHLLRVTNRCYKLDACRCERCIATQC